MNSSDKVISLEIRYILLMMTSFLTVCVYTAYATWFFQSLGFSAHIIGVLSATAGVGAVAVSTILGRLVDRSSFLTWKKVLALLLTVLVVLLSALFFIRSVPVAACAFLFVLIAGNASLPFFNSISVCLDIPFGPARALGSLAYALTGILLGSVLPVYGKPGLLTVAILGSALGLIVLATIPEGEKPKLPETAGKSTQNPDFPLSFLLVVIGGSLLMVMHSSINTYILLALQEVGGNEGSLGIATAISAGTEVVVLLLYGIIARHLKSRTLLILSGIFYTIRGVFLFLAASPVQIYLEQFLEAPSYGFFAGASVYYTNEVCRKEDRQLGQSIIGSTLMVGQVVGNIIGGICADLLGARHMLGLLSIPAFIGTLFIIAAKSSPKSAKTA